MVACNWGRLGVGNDPRYNNSRCFETFPFPTCTPAQQEKIRALGEQLDAHRKRQQALHPELTMTGMYNVLEAVRAGTTLNAKEKKIYDQGLVGILKQLHDELDAAVAEAYGWPNHLSTDVILTRLVALNAERAAEEAKGTVRWLRPEYQNKARRKSPKARWKWKTMLPHHQRPQHPVNGRMNCPHKPQHLPKCWDH
jgi:hypothetical protein